MAGPILDKHSVMSKWKTPPSFLAAMACIQIFSGSPAIDALYDEPQVPVVRAWQGTANDMPRALAQAVAPLIAQGYYIMRWEVSRANTGYMVELYHHDPGRLGSQRDDYRLAASRGMGISVRKFIRTQ